MRKNVPICWPYNKDDKPHCGRTARNRGGILKEVFQFDFTVVLLKYDMKTMAETMSVASGPNEGMPLKSQDLFKDRVYMTVNNLNKGYDYVILQKYRGDHPSCGGRWTCGCGVQKPFRWCLQERHGVKYNVARYDCCNCGADYHAFDDLKRALLCKPRIDGGSRVDGKPGRIPENEEVEERTTKVGKARKTRSCGGGSGGTKRAKQKVEKTPLCDVEAPAKACMLPLHQPDLDDCGNAVLPCEADIEHLNHDDFCYFYAELTSNAAAQAAAPSTTTDSWGPSVPNVSQQAFTPLEMLSHEGSQEDNYNEWFDAVTD